MSVHVSTQDTTVSASACEHDHAQLEQALHLPWTAPSNRATRPRIRGSARAACLRDGAPLPSDVFSGPSSGLARHGEEDDREPVRNNPRRQSESPCALQVTGLRWFDSSFAQPGQFALLELLLRAVCNVWTRWAVAEGKKRGVETHNGKVPAHLLTTRNSGVRTWSGQMRTQETHHRWRQMPWRQA